MDPEGHLSGKHCQSREPQSCCHRCLVLSSSRSCAPSWSSSALWGVWSNGKLLESVMNILGLGRVRLCTALRSFSIPLQAKKTPLGESLQITASYKRKGWSEPGNERTSSNVRVLQVLAPRPRPRFLRRTWVRMSTCATQLAAFVSNLSMRITMCLPYCCFFRAVRKSRILPSSTSRSSSVHTCMFLQRDTFQYIVIAHGSSEVLTDSMYYIRTKD